MEELAGIIRGIVMRHSKLPLTRVEEHDVLSRDLGFDSLAFLLTVSDLEQRYRFSFPLERIDELRDISFGELVTLVARERVTN